MVTLSFSAIGFLSPAVRGLLLTVAIMLYFFLAICGGYGAIRTWGVVNRTYAGWTAICLKTSCFYPGITMLVLTLLNFALHGTGSTGEERGLEAGGTGPTVRIRAASCTRESCSFFFYFKPP